MNLLHELPSGPDVPKVIHVVIEVPKASRNKCEYDFEVCKELEGVSPEVLGWEQATVAREQIECAADLCKRRLGEHEPETEA